MLILGISTINRQGSVALAAEDGTLVSESEIIGSSSLSRSLVPEVSRLLAKGKVRWGDVRLIAFTQGPGSFTSLRIGLAAVKGLVFGRDIPLVGVSSLQVLAAGVNCDKGTVVPLLDAKKGEVYCGVYSLQQGAVTACCKDFAGKPELVVELLMKNYPDALLLGDGYAAYRETFSGFQDAKVAPETSGYHAALLGMQGVDGRGKVSLTYCRSSEAEVQQGVALEI